MFQFGFGHQRENRGIHQVPQMPIMIDQIETHPETVLEFYGQPLHTVLDHEAHQGKMLKLFTDAQKAKDYSQSLRRNPNAGPFSGRVTMYQYVNLSGREWYAFEPNSVSDFRQLMNCRFLFFFCKDANKRVSSLRYEINEPGLILYEDFRFGGSSLILEGNRSTFIPRLAQFGWDRRASSLEFEVVFP